MITVSVSGRNIVYTCWSGVHLTEPDFHHDTIVRCHRVSQLVFLNITWTSDCHEPGSERIDLGLAEFRHILPQPGGAQDFEACDFSDLINDTLLFV